MVIAFIIVQPVYSQSKIWIKIEKGSALYLNPTNSEWVPVSSKEEISRKTFVLIKPESEVKFYLETEQYKVPSSGYFFAEDILEKSESDMVEALTKIELEQLPPTDTKTDNDKKVVGLTYGKSENKNDSKSNIPFYTERFSAIKWFMENKKFNSALLSLKRTMTKYPVLYKTGSNFEILCSLYDKTGLYGFLYNETNHLIQKDKSNELQTEIIKWNEIAKNKLLIK